MSELQGEMGNDVSALVGGDERETNNSNASAAVEKASGLQRDLHPTVIRGHERGHGRGHERGHEKQN